MHEQCSAPWQSWERGSVEEDRLKVEAFVCLQLSSYHQHIAEVKFVLDVFDKALSRFLATVLIRIPLLINIRATRSGSIQSVNAVCQCWRLCMDSI